MVNQILKINSGYKETELGIIPAEWDVVSFGSISKIKRGASPRPIADPKYFGKGRGWIRISDITKSDKYLTNTADYLSKLGELSSVNVDDGDVIMSIAASVGKPILVKMKACIHDGFVKFSSLSKDMDSEFLYYLIINMKNIFLDSGQQGTQSNINSKLVSKTLFMKPTLNEQKKIVEILTDIDKLITLTTSIISKKKNILNGTMNELLTGKKKLPGFDKEWNLKRLEDTFTLKARIGWQGLTISEYLSSGNFFLVTGTDFQNGVINWDDCHYVAEKRYSQDLNIQLMEHDILLTKDGTIGKVAYVDSLPKPATLNSGVFVIRPKSKNTHSLFFYYLLRSNHFINFLSRLSAGSTISHLYQKDFINYEFFMPETLEEQIQIAKILNDMDNEIKDLERIRNQYKMMKKGIMKKLLNGEIRLK